ncbi:hypothetical protein HNQ80_004720 [Anaerosolibacter carboniphilus]|uniref:Uncharacterized protein n=1 Tax=Anaerosolibacter carboniphilus TaxID=1417629 RepID=A0A841KXS2_9FIRM|nr:hypothetical protein [Anaerosolibacter carboniphilus]MBB6218546.1 hypothetical protein [Anaerosolibacter carboniphilus]
MSIECYVAADYMENNPTSYSGLLLEIYEDDQPVWPVWINTGQGFEKDFEMFHELVGEWQQAGEVVTILHHRSISSYETEIGIKGYYQNSICNGPQME